MEVTFSVNFNRIRDLFKLLLTINHLVNGFTKVTVNSLQICILLLLNSQIEIKLISNAFLKQVGQEHGGIRKNCLPSFASNPDLVIGTETPYLAPRPSLDHSLRHKTKKKITA